MPPTRKARHSICSIRGCPSISGRQLHRGVVFNTLPNNPVIRRIWSTNCGISGTKTVRKYLVCSRHFRHADFQLVENKYALKEGAVPTIFPWGTFPYVEPTPSTVAESGGSLMNIQDDQPGEMNQQLADIKSEWDDPETHPGSSKSKKETIHCAFGLKEVANVPIVAESRFCLGTRIEAQDLHGDWHLAKVEEVGNDEVMVLFEQNVKSAKPVPVGEWIPTNSNRFRPFHTRFATYVPEEECLARFNGRKFSATVKRVLGNDTYELLFCDGLIKVVRAVDMSKAKARGPAKTLLTPATFGVPPNPYLPIPKLDLSKLNLPPVPKDGEWCCNWVNEIPVGIEGYIEGPDGCKRPTIIVEDWRLPVGWTKHAYQRPGRGVLKEGLVWVVELVGPTNKRFIMKSHVKKYFEEKGEVYDPEIADFSMHIKRAKDLGLFIYTDNYKEELKNRKLSAAKALEAQLMEKLFFCKEPGCNKKFRKENQLQSHIKNNHNILANQHETDSDTSDASETAYAELANQQIRSQTRQPMDELAFENEKDAGKDHIATYHTPKPEHTEQYDTFFISYVDSEYD